MGEIDVPLFEAMLHIAGWQNQWSFLRLRRRHRLSEHYIFLEITRNSGAVGRQLGPWVDICYVGIDTRLSRLFVYHSDVGRSTTIYGKIVGGTSNHTTK